MPKGPEARFEGDCEVGQVLVLESSLPRLRLGDDMPAEAAKPEVEDQRAAG